MTRDAPVLTYVILVPAADAQDYLYAIGPFENEADAQTYITESKTDMTPPILSMFFPVRPIDDDADLNQ